MRNPSTIHRIIRGACVAVAIGAFVPTASAQTLVGAIDFHAHADPDGTARKIDVIDLAKAAKAAGMRAIILKNHYEPTASLAYIVRKEVPGIEVFGGISLDLTVGGVNPAAVEWMTETQQAAKLGALLELIYSPLTDAQLQKEADAIRTIGAASFVLSSDLGQPQNPLHTDGLLALYKGLMAKGVSAADIDLMSRKNPARLLGLER